MTLVPVWAIFGLSWNLLSGYTGLISFGHAAFFGVGAYAVVLGQVYFDLSPWIMIPLAAILGGLYSSTATTVTPSLRTPRCTGWIDGTDEISILV